MVEPVRRDERVLLLLPHRSIPLGSSDGYQMVTHVTSVCNTRNRKNRMKRIEIVAAFKPGITVEQEFRELTLTFGSSKNVRVENQPGTLTIVYRYTPGWAVLLGILGLIVFLLGLLFWLVKREDRVTVIGTDVEGGSRYTVQGVGTERLAEFLRSEFPLAA